MESLGLRPGWLWALAAGLAELVGGALLALGSLTPLATGLLLPVMAAATVPVHARRERRL